MPDEPRAVDLFSGAGGASLGIELAGFDLAAAVDHNTDALDTHAANLPGYTVSHDLADVDVSVLPERAQSPEYLHGSPPCKGFSTANGDRDADDPRNSLVFSFVEWLSELQPAVVTMENVTGMTNITNHFMSKVEAAFRDAGYRVKWRTLNAADFGVPQTRRRVITVGIRRDFNPPARWFPRPTHAETATTTLDGRQLSAWRTVGDAIGDLAGRVDSHRPQGENDGTCEAVWRPGDRPAHTMKGQGAAVVVSSTDATKNHDPRTTDFECRRAGKGGKFDPALLAWDDPSITIRAGGGEDGRGQRKPCVDADEPRRLTVRECARIQSFPDPFVFHGSKTAQYQQVGNAVPPRLQYHIANHLHGVVDGEWDAAANESASGGVAVPDGGFQNE